MINRTKKWGLMEAERADTIAEWENLKMMISSVSAEEATKIVKFAADSLKWLKIEESRFYSAPAENISASAGAWCFRSITARTPISEGVTPWMRPACPRVAGRICWRRIWASFLSP